MTHLTAARRRRSRRLRALVAVLLPVALATTAQPAAAGPAGGAAARAGEAPGAPGDQARWTTGARTGLGTSAGTRSKVWFTLTQGVMSEVYYPRVDVAATTSLQLVVTDGRTFTDVEQTDTRRRVQLRDRRSLSYRQVNTDLDGRYRIVKSYVTDPDRATVVVKVEVVSLDGGVYDAYVLHDPQLAGSSRHDSGRTEGSLLVATDTSGDTPVASALAARPRFRATSSGFDGVSDGLTDLREDHTLDRRHDRATDGDVVQVARLRRDPDGTSTSVLALGFARDGGRAVAKVRASLAGGWAALRDDYRRGWDRYLDGLDPAPRSVARDDRLRTRYAVALMTLRAHEDKTHRGANIASLTVPWGEAVDADEAGVGGHHLVWVRDLYEVATAQLAAGDVRAAHRSLDYLLDVQHDDGSFPQNTLLDGTPSVGSLRLDEVALPIVLARQLRRFDADTWGHVRRAADFLVAHGPATPQERWEEESGSSPGTTAAGIAGLVAAADLAERQGARAARTLYLATADEWRSRLAEWPLPTGERGEDALGAGRPAQRHLEAMAKFVRLAVSIDAGEPVERPGVITRRYAGERPAGPALEVTNPVDGLLTASDTVEVAGTTDARAAYLHVGGRTVRLTLDADGAFSRRVPLRLGRTTITVAVVGADGGTTLAQRTVTSTDLGTPLGSLEDPAGDDHGPGSDVHPADGAFVPGAFDLTQLGVYDADGTVNLAVTIDGELTNPWGGDQIAVQRFDVYVRPGGATSSGAVPARTGTNAVIASPYSFVVTADGFSGSHVRDADGRVVAEATLTAIPDLHQVVVSVPTSAFAGINLASARYVVTATSRVGAGEHTGEHTEDTAAEDTDTSDPDVLDVFVPVGVDQGEVLDRTSGSPVDLPWVDLGP